MDLPGIIKINDVDYKRVVPIEEKQKKDEMPRRCYVQKRVPAETAITDAMEAVEKMPADVRLTNALILLISARDKVGDFVDGIEEKPEEKKPPYDWPPKKGDKVWIVYIHDSTRSCETLEVSLTRESVSAVYPTEAIAQKAAAAANAAIRGVRGKYKLDEEGI